MRIQSPDRGIALFLVVFSAQLAAAQTSGPSANRHGAITGTLLNVDGEPLAGVKMCLCSRSLSIWHASLPYDDPKHPDGCVFCMTDGAGHFYCAPELPGSVPSPIIRLALLRPQVSRPPPWD